MKANQCKMGVALAAAALLLWTPTHAQQTMGPARLANSEPTERPVASSLESASYPSAYTNTASPSADGTCNSCGSDQCAEGVSSPSWCADCDDDCCSRLNIAAFNSMDSWRGPADGSYQSNFGTVTGFNAGTPLPYLAGLGIGGQFGASYGVFDWAGRQSNGTERQNQPQQQVFVTTGIFHRATDGRRLNWGVGFDWMINRNYGLLAQSPTVGQWRAMVGYNVNAWNEIGMWGAASQMNDTRIYDGLAPTITVPGTVVFYRPRSQANLFWHHKYAFGGDTNLWVGLSEQPRLGERGSQTPFILGGSMNIPLSPSLALYGSYTYVTSSFAGANAIASENDISNITLGMAWYPGAKARSTTVAGRCWAPYLPMANNGNFFNDTNIRF
jgi:hypothetical protein